jgi:hypothetical protein
VPIFKRYRKWESQENSKLKKSWVIRKKIVKFGEVRKEPKVSVKLMPNVCLKQTFHRNQKEPPIFPVVNGYQSLLYLSQGTGQGKELEDHRKLLQYFLNAVVIINT